MSERVFAKSMDFMVFVYLEKQYMKSWIMYNTTRFFFFLTKPKLCPFLYVKGYFHEKIDQFFPCFSISLDSISEYKLHFAQSRTLNF